MIACLNHDSTASKKHSGGFFYSATFNNSQFFLFTLNNNYIKIMQRILK